jgi:hypothetical protein
MVPVRPARQKEVPDGAARRSRGPSSCRLGLFNPVGRVATEVPVVQRPETWLAALASRLPFGAATSRPTYRVSSARKPLSDLT